jgi:hypothetical protein
MDIRQLAKVQGVHWRISREWIGESRIELHEWRWHIHIVSNVQELCLTSVAQPGGGKWTIAHFIWRLAH